MANRRVTMTSDFLGRHNRGKTLTVDATQFQYLLANGLATVADGLGYSVPESVDDKIASKVDLSAVRSVIKRPQLALRGVNVAGAEFGNPGQAYGSAWAHENAESFRYLASRGHRLIRYPFLWERLQPTLSGELDSAESDRLVQAVGRARGAGLQVILDLHNYGSYNGQALGAAAGPKQADFVDIWQRISGLFKDDPAILGYGLMNEPRNMPTVGGETGRDRWQTYSQAAVDAIRALGDDTCILVGGYSGSNMGSWSSSNPEIGNGAPWITDPADNFRYEAHQYWDTTGGAYTKTFAQEEALNVASWGSNGDATERKVLFEVRGWLNWLERHNVKGFIGEFGWPRKGSNQPNNSDADCDKWNAIGEKWMSVVESHGDRVWLAYWATGSKWSTGYNLQAYTATDGVLSAPTSVAPVLERHLTEVRPANNAAVGLVRLRDYVTSATIWRGENYDSVMQAGQSAPPAGQIFVTMIKLQEDGPISNVIVAVQSNGTGLIAGQCFAAIFDDAGQRLAVTDDISTKVTALANRSLALTTPTKDLKAGEVVYGAILLNTTTSNPQLFRTNQNSGVANNRRFGYVTGSNPSMPTSISLGSLQAASTFWMGVS